MASRPIDSFVKYFLDVKPYHTKILEIIEQHLFHDEFTATIKENIKFEWEWANDPLCKGVGYGLDFDDDCGYSPLSCCDLFDCVGGYGLIFDNTDLLVDLPIVGHDNEVPYVKVQGNHLYDKHIQIDEIPSSDTIKILGNYVSDLSSHALFLIKRSKTFNIVNFLEDGIEVAGNHVNFMSVLNEISIVSNKNTGRYRISSVSFDGINTLITLFNTVPFDLMDSGVLITASSNKNNGLYKTETVSFDGTHTIIQLHSSTPIPNFGEDDNGSIVLRTSLSQNRRVYLTNASTTLQDSPYYRIIESVYDPDLNETLIYLDIARNEGQIYLNLADYTNIELRGYYFGAGFDGFQECSIPEPYNIHVNISEFLYMEITEYPPPPPTPTPTPTPSPLPFIIDGNDIVDWVDDDTFDGGDVGDVLDDTYDGGSI